MDMDDWLPPPLPAKIGEPIRLHSFLDEVQIGLCRLFNGEDARADEFRSYLSTFNTVDSVTGKREIDLAFAAWHIKNVAEEDGDLPLVAQAKVIEIRRRIQWALRRQDTALQPYSWARRWAALEAAKAAGRVTVATPPPAAPPPAAPPPAAEPEEDNDNNIEDSTEV